MKEKTLLKIALSCSVVGLVVLFFISDNISVDTVDIGKIEDEEIGKIVKITGLVIRVNNMEKVMFIQVGQETVEKVDVVLFKDYDFDLSEGSYVEIIGEIEEYKGKKEIIANRIKII